MTASIDVPRHEADWPISHACSDGWLRDGVVIGASARTARIAIPAVTVGACVAIDRAGNVPALAEVVDVDNGHATCAPVGDASGIVAGAAVRSTLARIGSFVGEALLGSVTDAWGRCERACDASVVCSDDAPALSERAPIRRVMRTGVGAIDAFAPLGYGQRIALVAGAGVGKTSLLRRIVDGADVDARVVALVGERGREAAEFIASLSDARARATTVVCATAEKPAAERFAAARTATAQACALAARGRDVLLVVDSLTRVATAWRELALAAGETPAHRGHPPSLASALARLVERAGASTNGSITAVYAVLVDGDDVREPVTDAVRALLDGHIVLSRALADAGSFPAIDVLRSLSRVAPAIIDEQHRRDAHVVRAALSALERAEDLFAIGAYRPGGDPMLDAAVAARAAIERLIFDGDGRREASRAAEATSDPLDALAAIARRLREQPHMAKPDAARHKPRRAPARPRLAVAAPDPARS